MSPAGHRRGDPCRRVRDGVQGQSFQARGANRRCVARRHRLEHARRQLQTFQPENRYQAELQGTTLALLAYMETYWGEPERAEDFDRWWGVVRRYGQVLASGLLAGPGTRKRLNKLLDEIQMRPSDL